MVTFVSTKGGAVLPTFEAGTTHNISHHHRRTGSWGTHTATTTRTPPGSCKCTRSPAGHAITDAATLRAPRARATHCRWTSCNSYNSWNSRSSQDPQNASGDPQTTHNYFTHSQVKWNIEPKRNSSQAITVITLRPNHSLQLIKNYFVLVTVVNGISHFFFPVCFMQQVSTKTSFSGFQDFSVSGFQGFLVSPFTDQTHKKATQTLIFTDHIVCKLNA